MQISKGETDHFDNSVRLLFGVSTRVLIINGKGYYRTMGLEGFFKEVEKGEGCVVKVNDKQSRFQ